MYTVGQHVLLLEQGHGLSPFVIVRVLDGGFTAQRMDSIDSAMNYRNVYYSDHPRVIPFDLGGNKAAIVAILTEIETWIYSKDYDEKKSLAFVANKLIQIRNLMEVE